MPEDPNLWAARLVSDVPCDFFGSVTVEYRRGEIHKVTRTETFVSPEREQSYQKSIANATPIIRSHDFTK